MHFTREPIIQTVVTPKDGCKLVVRNSKGGGQEDYLVDAVEVVSFGEALFFRSLEKPKSFLVPVSDYEILELKETRMVLKNVGIEKSIKIGGGKDTSKSKDSDDSEKPTERKRERRRPRRRKTSISSPSKESSEASEKTEPKKKVPKDEADEKPPEESVEENSSKKEISDKVPTPNEAKVSTSFLSKLFPPPSSLIKDKLQKEREKKQETIKADDPEELQKKEKKAKTSEVAEGKQPVLVPKDEPKAKKSSEDTSEE